MIVVKEYESEAPEAFIFKGEFQGHQVQLLLIKATGELMINADDISKVLGNEDFGDLLSKNHELSNAMLDDMNEDYVEFSNFEILDILSDVNKIEDTELRSRIVKKLSL